MLRPLLEDSGEHAASAGDPGSPNARVPHVVYWHRELPPNRADVMGEGMLEATSGRVPGTLANRDQLWDSCFAELMGQARIRLEQEVRRLGGQYAHVLSESIDTRRNDATGEAWLHGTFAYVLLGRAADAPRAQ
jgi:hypothetical protein